MASEVKFRHTETGSTLDFTIRNTAGQYWNQTATANFETLTVANWTAAKYCVAMSEAPASSYFYTGTFPAISGNMVAGWYAVDIFKRASAGAPAISDQMLASFFGYWDGTTFKFWGNDVIASTGVAFAATGTVTTGASTTSVPTSACSPAGSVADQFKDGVMIFATNTTTAALRGVRKQITASTNSATPTFTVNALPATPASGDTFVIV